MIVSLSNQAYIFLVTIVIGLFIGLIYDFFRLIRKIFVHKNSAVYFEDVLFWLISTFVCFYILLHKNNLELRFYLFLGIVLGLIFYFALISHFVLTFVIKIITILLKPVAFIYNILKPHFKSAVIAKNRAINKEKIILQKLNKYGKMKKEEVKSTIRIIKDKI